MTKNQAIPVLLAISALLAESPGIRLKTFEDHRVWILHDGLNAEWQYRFPETVAAREGTFLTSPRTRMTWQEYPDGTWGYDWQSNPEYAAEAYQQIGKRLTMITGIEISPRIRIKPNRLELTLRLRNASGRTFHDVTSDGGCLQHRTERFFDDDHHLTHILTAKGITPLDQTDRTVAVRGKFFFNPSWYEDTATKAYEFFWGRSAVRPAAPWIASHASAGKGAIGIAWDNCMSLRQSSDAAHRCMHSSPYYGDLKPGESLTRRGLIVFADTIDEVISQLKATNLTPYTKPPEEVTP